MLLDISEQLYFLTFLQVCLKSKNLKTSKGQKAQYLAMVALANIEILNGCQNEKFITTYFGNIKFVQLFYTSQTFVDNMRINVMCFFRPLFSHSTINLTGKIFFGRKYD